MNKKILKGLGLMVAALPLFGCEKATYKTIDSNGSEVEVTSKLNVAHITPNEQYGSYDFKFTSYEMVSNPTVAYLFTLEDGKKMIASVDKCILFMDSCPLPHNVHYDGFYIH